MQGETGPEGPKGKDSNIEIGMVTTLIPGSQATASVDKDETTNTSYLNLGIPRGDKGDRGEKGDKGDSPVTEIRGEQAVPVYLRNLQPGLFSISGYVVWEGADEDPYVFDMGENNFIEVVENNNEKTVHKIGYFMFTYTKSENEWISAVETLTCNSDVMDEFKAQNDKIGFVKCNGEYGLKVETDGNISGIQYTYENYLNINNSALISKGTLEYVLTEFGNEMQDISTLTNYYTKTEINSMIGDIESILETLDIGSGL